MPYTTGPAIVLMRGCPGVSGSCPENGEASQKLHLLLARGWKRFGMCTALYAVSEHWGFGAEEAVHAHRGVPARRS